MKNFIKQIIRIVRPVLEYIVQIECWLSRKWVSSAHKRLLKVQWQLFENPEHFDHHIDLYYQWLDSRNPLWLERGIFGGITLKGEKVLELACGDGFNATNFYSLRSKEVVACDFDPQAIENANRKNRAENVKFIKADIRSQMPGEKGEYDNIVWDAAMEHFTESEIDKILEDIKTRLTTTGILSGYTLVERDDGEKHLHQHEYEFKSKEDLLRFFTPHFKNIRVFETIYPSRHNLYFWASDSTLPFDDEWPRMSSSKQS